MEHPVRVREAEERDVDAVRDLFVEAYGDEYPFKEFYDTAWLKKAVFDDATLFLVAEDGGRVVGTVSVLLSSGDLDDLIGEFGRLVVSTATGRHGLGTRFLEAAAEQVAPRIYFGFAEGRTAHPGSQKILERVGFVPVGFEPAKYRMRGRESTVLYARLFHAPDEARRNHPRVIAEIAPLAFEALRAMRIAPDAVIVEDDGFPLAHEASTEAEFEITELSERGFSPLLRIERGRLKKRVVFGNLSLSHGFFKISGRSTRYLVGWRRGAVVGGIGLLHDPIDDKVRIFELIGMNDVVKGRLLCEGERLAREELHAAYLEVDVSAYAPAIQRTLDRLGFVPVAYCPSMVFEEVERLDVVRMAKLTIPYFREEIPLTPTADVVRNLVEQALAHRREGSDVAKAAKSTELFRGLEDGDLHRLARLGRIRSAGAGESLARQGMIGDRLFIVIDGCLRALVDGQEVGEIGAGETAGELCMLDLPERSADLVVERDACLVEIMLADLESLMLQRPAIAAAVMRNLATSQARRLRRLNQAIAVRG